MKTTRALALALAALTAGFLAARWCAARPSNQPSANEPPRCDFGAPGQLESLVAYLQDTKQTNILNRFYDYSNASIALQRYSDLGMTWAVLQKLREGRTNEAYALLEGRLDADIIGFVPSYRELPSSAREKSNLVVLERAREYRAKYSFKTRYPESDEYVARAFRALDAGVS